jgi:hypothetical protein
MSLYIFLRHPCHMFRPSNLRKFDHPEKYLVKTVKHEVLHFADFSKFLLFPCINMKVQDYGPPYFNCLVANRKRRSSGFLRECNL